MYVVFAEELEDAADAKSHMCNLHWVATNNEALGASARLRQDK